MTNRYAEAAFAQLLLSGTLIHEGDFHDLQQAYGISLHPIRVMVISVDRYPDLASERPTTWRTEIGRLVVDVVSKTADGVGLPYLWLWTEEGVMALFLGPSHFTEVYSSEVQSQDVQSNDEAVLEAARAIQRNLRDAKVSVSIGIGSAYTDPNLLYRSFHEAVESMSGRFFQGNQLIFLYRRDEKVDEHWNDPLTREKTELLALLQMGDEHGVHKQLPDLLENMAQASGFNEKLFRSEAIDLVMMMSRAVLEAGIQAVEVLAENARVIHELYVTIRYDKFVRKAALYGDWLTKQVGQAQLSKASVMVYDAIQFVKQHHRERLSLDDVARHCCVSKYHLAHRFKEETGIGVIDFLNQIRIDKAVYYLNTSDLPVQQIAEQVGYEDANYFSRLFRKRTGYSPSAYRMQSE